MTKKLILFDIDGTLLKEGNKTHYAAFNEAFKKVYNIERKLKLTAHHHPGRTDTRIIFELLENEGLERIEIKKEIKRAFRCMESYFEKNVDIRDIKTLYGVENLLPKLKEKGYILGVVSGNVKGIGKTKLKKVGLIKFFEIFSFGDISEFRYELIMDAKKQFEKKFGEIKNEDIFVIGDTPHDIECGKVNGVKTIVVATGPYFKKELLKHRPDYAFDDFTDTDGIINAIEE